MKRFVIPFLFILSTFSKGIAQGDIEKNNFVNENAITAQAGLGYERVLFPLEEDCFGGLRAKVDLGSFTSGF